MNNLNETTVKNASIFNLKNKEEEIKMREPQDLHELKNKKLFFTILVIFLTFVASCTYYFISIQKGSFNFSIFYQGLMVGIIAQLVDGALGMAYGITSSTFLLATGVSPLQATSSTHIAEIFTTGASGLSHWYHGNVNKEKFKRLALGGVIGALVGVYVIKNFDGKIIKPYISAYLLLMGLYIILKAFRNYKIKIYKNDKSLAPLGFFAALIDSIGGGGWGPILTTTLLGQGRDPRTTVGSVNAAEFIITSASGTAFFTITGLQNFEIVVGIIFGGLLVTPFAAKFTKDIPAKAMYIIVGFLISSLSLWNIIKAFN